MEKLFNIYKNKSWSSQYFIIIINPLRTFCRSHLWESLPTPHQPSSSCDPWGFGWVSINIFHFYLVLFVVFFVFSNPHIPPQAACSNTPSDTWAVPFSSSHDSFPIFTYSSSLGRMPSDTQLYSHLRIFCLVILDRCSPCIIFSMPGGINTRSIFPIPHQSSSNSTSACLRTRIVGFGYGEFCWWGAHLSHYFRGYLNDSQTYHKSSFILGLVIRLASCTHSKAIRIIFSYPLERFMELISIP